MDSKLDLEQRSPLFPLLPYLYRLVLTSEVHKEYGLTKMQIIVLNALASRGVLSMTQIAEFIGSSKEQATRTVSMMVNMGLVERIIPEDNRTRVEIRLTDAGREFMQSYYINAGRRIREQIRAYLSQEEIMQLCETLDTAVQLLLKVK